MVAASKRFDLTPNNALEIAFPVAVTILFGLELLLLLLLSCIDLFWFCEFLFAGETAAGTGVIDIGAAAAAAVAVTITGGGEGGSKGADGIVLTSQ